MSSRRIEWKHSGKRLIIPVAVLPASDAENPSDNLRTEGLLDTGATGTGIHPEVAARLGLRSYGRRRVETANGLLWAREYVIRIGLFTGHYDRGEPPASKMLPHVIDRHFIGFELPAGFSYRMLIGMDLIGQCDLAVRKDGTARLDLP